MPTYLPAHIEELSLSENRLQQLPDQLYVPQMLQHLDLSRNLLQTLPEQAIGDLWMLTRLDLSENRLHRIADLAPTVHKLRRLAALHLRANPLGRIDGRCHHNSASVVTSSGVVLRSESLSELNVADCGLSRIERCAFVGLTNLTRLTLADNPLEHFTGLVSPSLRQLDISNCRLTLVASDAFLHTPALLYMDISRNPRANLLASSKNGNDAPTVINYMSTSLVHLDASDCGMADIPVTIFPNLEQISLRANVMRELPSRIFHRARHLLAIDLSRNLLSQIEDSTFQGAESLTMLNLSHNFISSIDSAALLQMNDLLYLDLSYNHLRRLTNISAPALTRLVLNHCSIEELPSNLPHTLRLDVSSNPISILPDSLFSFHIQELDLSYCRISSINESTFYGLLSLKKLDLRGNRLTMPFDMGVLASLKLLNALSVADNPWQCVCDKTVVGTTKIEHFLKFIIELSLKTDLDNNKYVNRNENGNFFNKDKTIEDNNLKFINGNFNTSKLIEVERDLKCRPFNSKVEILWSQACSQSSSTTEKPRRRNPERQWMAFIVTFAVVSSILIVLLVLRQNLVEESRLRRRAREEATNNNVEEAMVASATLSEDAPLTVRPVRSPIADILQLPTYEEAILLPKPIPDDFGVEPNRTREAATWISQENSLDDDDDDQNPSNENHCPNLNQHTVSTTSL
ncbi:insulin-like growth factor-binding protein complex acid labile subunit isoform X2 [Nilaparvata lugens]|nr:insulin-like growth factor-binding protein complex acid labile subunit isoform X2 [Nilaparvata lugens]